MRSIRASKQNAVHFSIPSESELNVARSTKAEKKMVIQVLMSCDFRDVTSGEGRGKEVTRKAVQDGEFVICNAIRCLESCHYSRAV